MHVEWMEVEGCANEGRYHQNRSHSTTCQGHCFNQEVTASVVQGSSIGCGMRAVLTVALNPVVDECLAAQVRYISEAEWSAAPSQMLSKSQLR